MVPIQQSNMPREIEVPDTSRGMRERVMSDHPSSFIKSVITCIQIIEQLIKQQTYHSKRRCIQIDESYLLYTRIYSIYRLCKHVYLLGRVFNQLI
jgi:hypothetical protein